MTITNDGVSTLIACDGAAGKVEPKYLAALSRVGRWRITGTRAHALDAHRTSPPRVPRVDRRSRRCAATWDVTGLYTGDAISSPVPGSALTLQFAGDTASGDSGCNTYIGPFATERHRRHHARPVRVDAACLCRPGRRHPGAAVRRRARAGEDLRGHRQPAHPVPRRRHHRRHRPTRADPAPTNWRHQGGTVRPNDASSESGSVLCAGRRRP